MDSIGIIINKKAKNAAEFNSYLNALEESNLPFSLYEVAPNKLDSIIKKSQKKHSILLIGGGDGTVRSAAQQCVNTDIILGILPLGTMNHFVKELVLPLTPADLVLALKRKKTTKVDVAEVNGYIFVNNSTLGFYPKFAKHRDYYTKRYNKWLSYIPGIIQALRRHETFSINIKGKGLNLSLKTSFLMVSNNLYSYEFPLSIKRESFTDSNLGIYCYKHGKLEISKLIHYFFRRKASFEIKKTTLPLEVAIENRKKVTISLDGDTVETTCPLKYRSHPKSLTLLANAP